MTLTLALLIALASAGAGYVLGQIALLDRSCGWRDPVVVKRWGRSVIVRRVG